MSSSQSAVTSSTVSPSSERFIGRVKWFNNKAGYGFVTITDGSKSGSDVFVHHSSIKVDSEQYKYLVQGEYVEFNLSNTTSNDHEFQAGEVCGIKGGKLMCETRRDLRVARFQYKSSRDDDEISPPKASRPPRQETERNPRSREQGEWTHVVKNKKSVEPAPVSVQETRKPVNRGRGRPPRASRSEAK